MNTPNENVKQPMPPFENILVPTDVSDNSNSAVPTAYHLARNGSTVHLLHVCQPPFFGNAMYGMYVQGYVPTQEEVDAGRSRIRKALKNLEPTAAIENGIRTEYHLVDGADAAKCIAEQAKALSADVVVMSTRGRTGLKKLLMGSIAADVMKQTDLSVILVHQGPAKE